MSACSQDTDPKDLSLPGPDQKAVQNCTKGLIEKVKIPAANARTGEDQIYFNFCRFLIFFRPFLPEFNLILALYMPCFLFSCFSSFMVYLVITNIIQRGSE